MFNPGTLTRRKTCKTLNVFLLLLLLLLLVVVVVVVVVVRPSSLLYFSASFLLYEDAVAVQRPDYSVLLSVTAFQLQGFVTQESGVRERTQQIYMPSRTPYHEIFTLKPTSIQSFE
jgi:hypothetical protein